MCNFVRHTVVIPRGGGGGGGGVALIDYSLIWVFITCILVIDPHPSPKYLRHSIQQVEFYRKHTVVIPHWGGGGGGMDKNQGPREQKLGVC